VLPYLSAARDGSGTLRETSPDRRLTLDPRLPRPFPRPALLETRRARALLTGGTLVLLAVLAPLLTPLPNWFTWLCAALGAILAAGTPNGCGNSRPSSPPRPPGSAAPPDAAPVVGAAP
jgi:hypothetical protein